MGNTLVNSQIIEGVIFQPLKQIKDDRGAVMHHLNFKSPTFKGFEEVYISKTFPGIIKAWKMHLKMTQNFCVPVGAFKFVIFDCREDSITKNCINEFYIDDDLSYSLLTVPPGVYYGFQCLSECSGIIVNLSNLLFDPSEVVRLDIKNEIIHVYPWREL
jgi:dTDP-4-dehydrorhamnose 3,5-epimerase